jgi:hypothetical protein
LEVTSRIVDPGQSFSMLASFLRRLSTTTGIVPPSQAADQPRSAAALSDEELLRMFVVAVADGYGPDWAQIRDSEKRANLSLKLVEDLPLNGRLLDQNRKPVAEARIRVLQVSSDSDKGVMQSSSGILSV